MHAPALHTARLGNDRAAPRVSVAADLGARLVDFEVNPLIVRAQGEGAIAVDSRGPLTETSDKEPDS